jgi:hypothetical protein
MRSRKAAALVVAGLAISSAAAAHAAGGPRAQAAAGGRQSGGGAVAPFKNLQVLPKDTPPADVMARMNIMVEALGVQCAYCHKFEGPGSPANDFASDEKPAKNVARSMMRFDAEVNDRLLVALNKPADQVTRVRCITCHRGAPIPVTPPSPLRQSTPSGR